jgi:hypothetical protein
MATILAAARTFGQSCPVTSAASPSARLGGDLAQRLFEPLGRLPALDRGRSPTITAQTKLLQRLCDFLTVAIPRPLAG